jgi:SNF2 family DNA or RNA helicase
MVFLNPGLLGSQTTFRSRFYKPIQLWKNEKAASRLKELTSPFILRRLKTDKTIISDLPEKIETKEYCTLTREQVTLYKAVLNEMEEKILASKDMERKGMILATLTRLKQICNHPAQFAGDTEQLRDRSGKLTRLLEMLGQIRTSGEHSLIFTQYAEMGRILQTCLREEFMEDVYFLSGQVSRKKRDEMVRSFQEDPGAPHIFILSLKAGGTGLNLSRANHVFHYDRWWNPAVENQATDRAFRIGQKKNVQVHKFLVAGTLEDRIDQMIENKSDLADRVVGKGEAGLTELSDKQIKELLKLGIEATGD